MASYPVLWRSWLSGQPGSRDRYLHGHTAQELAFFKRRLEALRNQPGTLSFATALRTVQGQELTNSA